MDQSSVWSRVTLVTMNNYPQPPLTDAQNTQLNVCNDTATNQTILEVCQCLDTPKI